MNLYERALERYCEEHSTPPSQALSELDRETHLKTLAPQMLTGHIQGQFLRLISLLVSPRKILEVGTFTGYGALCMAEGLVVDGELHTIEANPEMEHIIRKYIELTGNTDRIHLHRGDALKLLPTLKGPWDLVFIDAAKQDYLQYYNYIIDKVRPGGLIIADNVLWSGKVINQRAEDADAAVLHAFNQKIQADERVENLLLPLRDGIMIIRKRQG